MLDIRLRPVKDAVFDPLCKAVPSFVAPLHVTGLGFAAGLVSCYCAATGQPAAAVSLWLVNRALDCLDGALARHRGQASDLGGFLDLLCDFIYYSLIPIACAYPALAAPSPPTHSSTGLALAVAAAEASFHVNNFVLFYVAAVVEKRRASGNEKGAKELTSVSMRPALIEGTESGLVFTAMLAIPGLTEILCWALAVLVCFGVVQRVVWVLPVLG